MVRTTPTEERLGMSLPADLRDLPAEEVEAGQSLRGGQSIPRRRRGGGGGGPAPPPPPPRFESELLQQSFPSAAARQRAESEFRAQQAAIQRAEEQRQEAAAEGRVAGQLESTVRTGARVGVGLDVPRPPTIARSPFLREPRPVTELKAGFVTGVLPKTPTEVVVTAASLGAGALVGGGLRVGGAGLRAVAPRITPLVSRGLTVAGTGLAGTFAVSKGAEFAAAPTPLAKGEVAGVTARELTAFSKGIAAGTRVGGRAVGRIRTAGLTELPAQQIIAPEFPRQTFPTVRRGQTAGQLLGEFKPILPGETRPAGFTASPEPIAELTVRRGTSELPGLFQAPRVSPRFLRIQAEAERPRLFGIEPLGGRPSIIRVTPQEFRLTPLTSPRQRGLSPVRQTQQFFETAPKGVSFVPFIKTEKEAVIPFETALRPTGRRFFTTFQRERVPIFEFEALPGRPVPSPRVRAPRLTTARQVSSSLRPSRGSIISPTSLGAFGVTSSSLARTGRSISSGISSTGRGISSGIVPPSRPRAPTRRPPRGPPGRPPSRPTRRPTSRTSLIPSRPSAPLISLPRPTEFTTIDLPDRRPRRKVKRKPTKKRRRRRFRVAPSFTAVSLDIRGRFPKQRFDSLGLTPEQIRVIPT